MPRLPRRYVLPVLMLSIHAEELYAVRAMKLVASGYITKEKALDELIKAIRKVRTGGKYITSSLAERLADTPQSDTEKPLHESLSNREYQVMCLTARGKKIGEIAEELFLSPSTIKTHRLRIFRKIGMRTTAELTRYTTIHHLIDGFKPASDRRMILNEEQQRRLSLQSITKHSLDSMSHLLTWNILTYILQYNSSAL